MHQENRLTSTTLVYPRTPDSVDTCPPRRSKNFYTSRYGETSVNHNVVAAPEVRYTPYDCADNRAVPAVTQSPQIKHRRTLSLPGANLRSAHLYQADLSRANLRNADLCGADLRKANLSRADLRQASLFRADLQHVQLSHADLRQASLYRADLRNADLKGADLRGTKLRAAKLRGARYDSKTSWPKSFDPCQRGAVPIGQF